MTDEAMRLTYGDFKKRAADVNAAMTALGAAADQAGLSKELTEIVKIRASQINACGFCNALHRDVSARLGMPAAKLDAIARWRESDGFTPREKAALAWTELLTGSLSRGIDPADRAALLEHFTEDEAIYLTVTVGTINQWNRIALGLGFPEPVTAKA
jgi:AhpD family alkylhydroperoxidase